MTPEPWVQYLQWINYAFLLIPFTSYIGAYRNKDIKLKLYELSPYLIALNLIQTMVNPLPYKEPFVLGINLLGNVSMICILISQFIKMKVTDKKDRWIKRFIIDIPLSIYYQSCIINSIFIINQIIYEVNPSYMYDVTTFIGFILILFILNVCVLFVTRNIFKGLLFSILMLLYGIYVNKYENNTNIKMNEISTMRVIILLSFITNSLIVFIYTVCYCKHKKELEQEPLKSTRII